MANEQNKLINQGQFRNLGNHLELSYVDRDTANLTDAIKILQNKLDYINYKYRPEAVKQAQKKLGLDDQTMNDTLAHWGELPKHKAEQVRAIIYGTDDDPKDDSKTDESNGDEKEGNHDEDHHDQHPQDNDHHDRQGDQKSSSHHQSQESNQDLDFLNKINHK